MGRSREAQLQSGRKFKLSNLALQGLIYKSVTRLKSSASQQVQNCDSNSQLVVDGDFKGSVINVLN